MTRRTGAVVLTAIPSAAAIGFAVAGQAGPAVGLGFAGLITACATAFGGG